LVGGKAGQLTKGADELTKLLKGIQTMMGSFKNIGQITGAAGKAQDSSGFDTMIKSVIISTTNMFKVLSSDDGIAMYVAIDTAKDKLEKSSLNAATMMKISSAFGAMVLPVESFKTWKDKITPLIRGGYGPQIKAMGEMIKAIEQIDGILSQTHNIDIQTTLTKFAANFGVALGQKGQYTVMAKDVVINVKFAVAIDATQLESAILSANNSKIKEKINVLIGAFGEQNEDTAKWKEADPNSNYGMVRRTPAAQKLT